MTDMGLLSTLSPWDAKTYGNSVLTLRVLVECEKGSTCKYEYDDANNMMVVVHQLHKRYPYPYSYGSIPQTLAQDGDPLDAIIVSDEVIRSGTVVNCFPIAVIHMTDNLEEDDKILCVPFYYSKDSVNLAKIYKYLSHYKYPHQKGTKLTTVQSADAAVVAINKAHNLFLKNLTK